MTKKMPKFVKGHMYSIDFYDHARVNRASEDDPDHTNDFILRQRGVFLGETRTSIVIEHNRHITDNGSQRVDTMQIVKSAIKTVRHYGKE